MQWIITQGRTCSASFTPVGMGVVSRQVKYALNALPQEAREPFINGYADHFTHEFQVLNVKGEVDCAGACDEPSRHSLVEVFAPLDYAMSMYGSLSLQTRPKGSSRWIEMQTAKA